MESASSSALPIQPQVRYCPCGLTQDQIERQNFVVKGYCTAPKEDDSPCGKRWADHPRDKDLNPPPAPVPPAGQSPMIFVDCCLLFHRIVQSCCNFLCVCDS
jgi:hypothetical protein